MFEYRSHRIAVRQGDLLYVPPQVDYVQQTDGEKVIVVHFQCAADHGFGLHVFTPEQSQVPLFERMLYEWQRKRPGYTSQCLALFYELMTRMARQDAERMTPPYLPGQMQKAVEHLHLQFSDHRLTVAELAYMAGMSEVSFRKHFERAYHAAPLHYLTHLRIAHAKELLPAGYYTISEVADRCGFADTRYFSTVFKRYTGDTPSDFARQER